MSMIDRRRKPITTSSSDHTPPSSGPRWRMSLQRALDVGRRRSRGVAVGRQESDQSTHVGQYPRVAPVRDPADGMQAHGVPSSAVARFAHELVAAHPAPRRDVGARGRIVGLDRDRRADGHVADVAGPGRGSAAGIVGHGSR